MTRPITAHIHTGALRHNLQRVRRAAPDARLWAVVKADAYGHGIERAFAGLRGANGFALLEVAEAERLRAFGWRGPIVLIEGTFDARELEECSRLQLAHVVHCNEQLEWLAAHRATTPQHVLLKLNSGMNRLGFAPQAYRSAYARLAALPQVASVGHITHFADADGSEGIAAQWCVFQRTTEGLPGEKCVCNSAATLLHGDTDTACDWVRAGIVLYGAAPDFPAHSAADWELRPAMSLRTRLLEVHGIAAGEAVGYGFTFRAEKPMRIATAACGYADGYPRSAGDGAPVLVDGVRTRTIGRISMDMLAVDVTDVPQARMGSEVVLWGTTADGRATLPIDEVAHAAGTISYELMCAVAPRVPVHTDKR